MAQFYDIVVQNLTSPNRPADYILTPDWLYSRNTQFVAKGGRFYAFWDGGSWNRSRQDLIEYIDDKVFKKGQEIHKQRPDASIIYKLMSVHRDKVMSEFDKYTKLVGDADIQFNQKILFAHMENKPEYYATAQLDYSPVEGSVENYQALMDVLYTPQDQQKIQWALGAVLTSQTMDIQKMLFLYGAPGSGKGTVFKIIHMLLDGYIGTIDLGKLTSNDPFATDGIDEMPLLLDEDADASMIRNDTHLLKLTAHEPVIINRKFVQPYPVTFTGMIIAASNKPIKIRDIESGLTRRIIGVYPTGNTLDGIEYRRLMDGIKFEIPHIAQLCIDTYNSLGATYYDGERPVDHMLATDYVFKFFYEMATELPDPISYKDLVDAYCYFYEEQPSPEIRRKITNEAHRYYNKYHERLQIDGVRKRRVYADFDWDVIYSGLKNEEDQGTDPENPDGKIIWYNAMDAISPFDESAKTYPAQLANNDGYPTSKWDNNKTILSDIDTRELHFVKVPLNHIVLDFDIKDENGEKDFKANLAAAMKYPPTYMETSKSGGGLHLHYIYDGDVDALAKEISEDIEIKVYRGNASLRRKLTKHNAHDITHISAGLPLKERKQKVYKDVEDIIYTEKTLRKFINTQLGKNPDREPSHTHTTPTINWISDQVHLAKEQGLKYDITDLRHDVMMRAIKSTNQREHCIKTVQNIPWSTMREDVETTDRLTSGTQIYPNEELVFFDIEVYPNLFVVVWKKWHEDTFTRWVNPTSDQIRHLCSFPLVGFNNRRYDNHILYGAIQGMTPYELFRQSDRIINEKNAQSGMFAAAYELSYTDIYEYAKKKQSLKKWEVEMGFNHIEMEIPWDQPVPDELVDTVVEYCVNDVAATEALFDFLPQDYAARQILATMANGTMNATNNQLTALLIFGRDKNPQNSFNYRDLAELFPGYRYEFGKSEYRGVDPSEGGYVYAEPGIYKNVPLLDVESLHPNSLINENYFGPYTQRYADLLEVRVHVKHGEIDIASKMFDGALAPFLKNPENTDAISDALKIAINSVYGMTSAKFDNKFKHPDNKDNFIAKRGALFMIDLMYFVQEKGYTVVHIKTDSIKIANGDDYIIKAVHEFGSDPKYGYKFDHEDTYDRIALINNSTYIAYSKNKKKWTATGAEFQGAYFMKYIWTKEPFIESDYWFTKQSKGKMYIDDHFVGKVGSFYASKTGGELTTTQDNEKFSAVQGTKGFKFKTTDQFSIDDVDLNFYNAAVITGLKKIMKVGDIHEIVDDIPGPIAEALEIAPA